MHYGLSKTLNIQTGGCLVLGLFSDLSLPKDVVQLDQKWGGVITRLSKKLQEKGDLIWQADIDGSSLLMIHCGDHDKFTTPVLTKRMAEVSQALIKQRIQIATLYMPKVLDIDANAQLQHMVIAIDDKMYQCLDFKSVDKKPHALETVTFTVPGATQQALHAAQSITQGIRLTRQLANLPANVCTPTFLASQALQLAEEHHDIQARIMDRDAIKKLGMGAFLAVAQGSTEPPQFIEVQYKGKTNKPPIVLVGKGVTFDSGGISLKPPASMEEMKYDMAGAASVLGTIKACALLQLPLHVIGLIPATENMPSGSAVKPGDIVTTMSGQTVEIVNTDAEGRLILADALTYAEQFKPEFVIDIATLTGAAIIALGHENSGLLTPDDALADEILKAAQRCGDATWRLPLHDAYQELIDTPLADMANSTGDRAAGTITAACFLSRYTKNYRWAHLDVAGTAWVSGSKRHATGRPVPLLIEILTHAC